MNVKKLLLLFLLSSINYSQSKFLLQDKTYEKEWHPLITVGPIIENNNLSELPDREKSYTNLTGRIENNYQTDLNSYWVRLKGPIGGTARRFEKIDGKLYLLSDRKIFYLNNFQWEPLNLKHDGSNINFIYKIANDTLIVGGDTFLYKSTDNGESWQQFLFDDSVYGFSCIIKTPNNEILIGTSKGIYISESKTPFDFQLLTLNGVMINCINFDKNGNIWVGADRSVRKAKYGEFSWQTMSLNSEWYRKILVDSKNNIYTFSDYQVLKSSNFGTSWNSINGSRFVDIAFDPNQNLIVTAPDRIFRLSYKGIIWESSKYDRFMLTTCYYSDDELLVGLLGAGVRKYSISKGSFDFFSQGLNVSTVRGILQFKNGSLLASTDVDSLFRSDDGGSNWKAIYECWTRYMEISKLGTVYVGADSRIIKSNDNGNNWIKLNINIGPYYFSYIDIGNDDKVICAASSNGDIYLSKDFGENFVKIFKSDLDHNSIKIINDNTYIIYNGKNIYYTEDSGKKFVIINDNIFGNYCRFFTDKYGNIYSASPKGLAKSFDGKNWQFLTDRFEVSFFTIDSKGLYYILDPGGYVYISYDRGNKWEAKIYPFSYSTRFWSFLLDKEGNIFYGSQDEGLFRNKINFLTSKMNWQRKLYNNFPNPFQNYTNIEYSLKEDALVELKVYNIIGEEVDCLFSEFQIAGFHNYKWVSKNLPSGVYFYQLIAGSYIETKKMIILK